MSGYKLSKLAQEDIIRIADYTLETWGEKQTTKYLSQLEQRLESLVENPLLGKTRDDIKEGYRSYPEGSHIIFYRIKKDFIEIIGIPNQREDIEHHFDLIS